MAVILLYHSVAETVTDPVLQVSLRSLVRHLDWCAGLGYEVVPVADALAFSAEKLVGLTFDDGFASFMTAWPVLNLRGVRPTLMVCPRRVGGCNAWAGPGRVRERLLGLDEIRSLEAEGVAFGGHGWDHRPFLARDVADDLARTDIWFRTTLGAPPGLFAWPFGLHDEEATRAVGREFQFALGVEPSWDEEVCPLAVPRAIPVEGMTEVEFADELMLKSFVFDPTARRT